MNKGTAGDDITDNRAENAERFYHTRVVVLYASHANTEQREAGKTRTTLYIYIYISTTKER